MTKLTRQLSKKDWERIVDAVCLGAEDCDSRYERNCWESTYRRVSSIVEEIHKYKLEAVAVEPINCPHGIHSPYECSVCQGVKNE